MVRKHFPRGKAAVIAALVLVLGGFGMVSARVIPGIDEPYNPAAYYSLTAISWEDSPSPFALRDLAENGGNVYDYTRHIKSILFGDNFKDILDVAMNMTQNDIINTTPFSPDIYAETDSALSLLRQGTETIGKQVDISESNPYLRQGDNDEWEAYNEHAYDRGQKQIWLDQSYRQMVEGSQQELVGMENALTAANAVLDHSNQAKGELQLLQAQNELKALLVYEFARQNALDANIAQLNAVRQANEYDETAESAFLDAITRMDVADPYDSKEYALVKESDGYEKPEAPGMPDFE